MRTLRMVPPSEITFEPASMIDRAGRVFWWNGRIYRAIRSEHAEFYRSLFDSRNIESLFDSGLVSGEVVPLSVDGFGLVLRHQRVPVASYCMEWSAGMLKDGALLLCDLSMGLAAKGLTLRDAHPWNIMFDGGRPLFVDWGSIGLLQQQAAWPYPELRDRFLFPLCLMAAGRSSLARAFMLDTMNRQSPGDVYRLLLGRIAPRFLLRYWLDDRALTRASRHVDQEFFRGLRHVIEVIPMAEQRTEWTEYEGPDGRFSHDPCEEWPAKIRNVHDLLGRLGPRTVLDVGCSRGWFSELAARQGAQVTAIDIDEPSVTKLYRHVRERKLPILPLVMDICAPTPAHGVARGYPAAEDRLRSEMVMALAITHHLVFKRGLTFELISKQLALFAEKWLVVEFVPPEDRYVSQWVNERFAWYGLEGFVRALQVFFKRIEILESSPSPRLLLWCER